MSKNTKQNTSKLLSKTTVFNIDNNRNVPNQYIRMVSEGSCDTEDWRNAAKNSAEESNDFLNIFKHLKMVICKLINITVFTVYLIIKFKTFKNMF